MNFYHKFQRDVSEIIIIIILLSLLLLLLLFDNTNTNPQNNGLLAANNSFEKTTIFRPWAVIRSNEGQSILQAIYIHNWHKTRELAQTCEIPCAKNITHYTLTHNYYRIELAQNCELYMCQKRYIHLQYYCSRRLRKYKAY